MGFWERIKRLFSLNINAVLDAAEDPKLALDQIVKDMDVELRNTKTYLAEAIVNQKKLERDYERHAAMAKDYEAKAKAILTDDDESNDYLAKEALLRKKENEGVAAQYKTAADKQRESVETFKRNIEKMGRKIEDAKRKKGILLTQSHIAETQQKIVSATAQGMGTGGAFDEYKRIEEKLTEKTERAQVNAELASVSTIDDQLEEVAFDSDVDGELEAMKAQLQLEGRKVAGALPPAK